MKLHRLAVHNFRGLRGDFEISLGGGNLVIYGPNGTGKSSIVDAITFLLTGRVSRLTGAGTGGISLREHGAHVQAARSDTWVAASITLPGETTEIHFRRVLDNPSRLECEQAHRTMVESACRLALHAPYLLTRRNLLLFITAPPADRSQQMQTLLNLSALETYRRAIVSANNTANRSLDNARSHLATSEQNAAQTAGLANFDEGALLNLVNEARETLHGSPILELAPESLKSNLQGSGARSAHEVNTELLGRDAERLIRLVSEEGNTYKSALDSVVEVAQRLVTTPDLADIAQRADFLAAGIALLENDAESCPFCDDDWRGRDLKSHVTEKHSAAHDAVELTASLSTARDEISRVTESVRQPLESVVNAARRVPGYSDVAEVLHSAHSTLATYASSLPTTLLELRSASRDHAAALAAWSRLATNVVREIVEAAKAAFDAPSRESTAWELLTRLEVNLEALTSARKQAADAEEVATRTGILQDVFLEARDAVLASLYDSVRDRFVRFYRQVHPDDEAHFDATITADRAGVDLEVDFYGHGMHVPHALHSEGHQDSMGVCLFLALSECTHDSHLDLLLLDDVVMSVDIAHRQRLASLLAEELPDRQLLVTTHDQTWARQLRSAGVVTDRSGLLQLLNWNVNHGPTYIEQAGRWQRVDQHIAEGRHEEAAFLLRKESEAFFWQACTRLRGKVTLSETGRYELGELLDASISRLKECYRRAANSASRYGQPEVGEQVREADSVLTQGYLRLQRAQWVVNDNVHFNPYEHDRNDVQHAVDAMKDLVHSFECQRCSQVLSVVRDSRGGSVVKCRCGAVNYAFAEG